MKLAPLNLGVYCIQFLHNILFPAVRHEYNTETWKLKPLSEQGGVVKAIIETVGGV